MGRRLIVAIATGVVLTLVPLAGADAQSDADSEIFTPKPEQRRPREEPKAEPRTTPRQTPRQEPKSDPAPRQLSCVDVKVSPSEITEGVTWDPWAGHEKPDIRITETGTGATTQCDDSLSCTLRVRPQGGQITLRILDDDVDGDDPIGSGSCKVGGSCTLGEARIRMSAC